MRWVGRLLFFALVGMGFVFGCLGLLGFLVLLMTKVPVLEPIFRWVGLVILGLFFFYALGVLIMDDMTRDSNDRKSAKNRR